VKPSWDKDVQVALTLDWSGMPAGWAIANSFHAGNRSYTGRCRVGDLENSFWGAGNFRLMRKKIHGKPVYVAVRGKWVFSDNELQERAMRIIGAERSFWKDNSEPHFLLSLVPFSESGHYNGSALHQAFFLGMSADSMASGQLTKLLAHEYMHRWIGGKLQLAGREEAQYWFSEGFTEYYTYKVLYTSGYLTLPGYLGSINRMLAEYYLSPVRTAVQQAAADSFWLAPAFQRLPYTKGFAYALYLDASMQERGTGSLDGFLFELLKAKGDSVFISGERFNALLQQQGIPADSLQQAWIANGGVIPVKALPLAARYTLKVRDLAAFELGFNAATLKKGAPIGGVLEGSAAWDAGLRNGMLAESYSIYYDQPGQPVVLNVRDGAETRRITYLPKKKQSVSVPQYEGVED
ncbi:MAG: hypothetical protein EOO11_20605, partial [Chitinophagaceae bacterium]